MSQTGPIAADMPGLNVLVAEDNKINQALIIAMLEPLGVRVRLVDDGEQAVEAFRSERCHLILMDIQMPQMNGVDAALAIRAIESGDGRARTPILAVSANVMPHQVAEYARAGMDGVVAKPILLADLLSSIERAMSPIVARRAQTGR